MVEGDQQSISIYPFPFGKTDRLYSLSSIILFSTVNGYCTSPNDCTCNGGYTGPICNILENPCDYLSPCVHGNCTNEDGGSYSCGCEAGYTGSECETEIDECVASRPCLNGAICEVRQLVWVQERICVCLREWGREEWEASKHYKTCCCEIVSRNSMNYFAKWLCFTW